MQDFPSPSKLLLPKGYRVPNFFISLRSGANARVRVTGFCRSLLVGVLAVAILGLGGVVAQAQTLAAGKVTGLILDQAQVPVAKVEIVLTGAVTKRATTDDHGVFEFDAVTPGLYSLNVTKAGFTPLQDSIVVTAGSVTNAKLQLAAASLNSISEIGRVVVTNNSGNALNTSTAAVATVSGSSFIDQGQLNVNRVRVQIGVGSHFAGDGEGNSASPIVTGIPQIRGSLPYETASLIDGHPISIGAFGTFNPAFINPYILQDVEVVKGPGASAPNINYAIGGTVNFRTLEPTQKVKQSVDLGIDQWGGMNANLRATGTVGKLGYAFDYATQGTKGTVRGFNPLDPLNVYSGAIINGVLSCTGTGGINSCPPGLAFPVTPYAGQLYLFDPVALCCPQVPLDSSSRNELAKIRYSFTPTTSLTVTYVGGQIRGSAFAADLYYYPSYFFGPPAGYTGSLPNGADLFDDSQGDSALNTNANLYSADFRTALGPVTFNARYYVAAVDTANLNYGDGPLPGSGTFTGILYGGVPLGSDANPTIFNGVPATVTLLNQYVGVHTYDKLNGFTAEADLPVANNVYSVSYDTVSTKSAADTIGSTDTPINVPSGSGQTFQTIMARGQFELRPNLDATLSNYATSYTDHYSQDFGVTFQDSSHSYDAPRLSFSWRPTHNTAVRAATGFSIAPPYINLLTNSTAGPDRQPATYFTVTNNAGDVKPETAFGFDLGIDQRVAPSTILSADVYQTTLHNQFLSTTSLSATPYVLTANNQYASPAGDYPLYVTQTANLGHSRYEGIELALKRAPVVGFGYKIQGSLQRAYAYDLPPGFYDTAAGPDTANLGILPNENFQGAGQGYNSLSPSRVPYSQGYAEINHRGGNGAYALLGVTYYGNNNSFNEPPFGVVNGSYNQPLWKHGSLLLAVSNITSAYSDFRFNIYGGIPTPLVNGQLGLTAGNVIGPSTASLTLHVDL
jgi:outer membrane receptor protein involved in Fe transport